MSTSFNPRRALQPDEPGFDLATRPGPPLATLGGGLKARQLSAFRSTRCPSHRVGVGAVADSSAMPLDIRTSCGMLEQEFGRRMAA